MTSPKISEFFTYHSSLITILPSPFTIHPSPSSLLLCRCCPALFSTTHPTLSWRVREVSCVPSVASAAKRRAQPTPGSLPLQGGHPNEKSRTTDDFPSFFCKPGHGLISLSATALTTTHLRASREKYHPGPVMVRGYLSVRATGGAAEPLANDWRGAGEWLKPLLKEQEGVGVDGEGRDDGDPQPLAAKGSRLYPAKR